MHVSQYYKTLFQWEYKGIRMFVNFILKWKIEIFYSFSTLRIFHTPHFPHSAFSTPRIFHTPHFPHPAFSTLRIFHTPHFPHPAFSTLCIFHTPHFPHSALCVFHRTIISSRTLSPSHLFFGVVTQRLHSGSVAWCCPTSNSRCCDLQMARHRNVLNNCVRMSRTISFSFYAE